MSSLGREPVVLAAISVGGEIATFTDQYGSFFFELTTVDRQVTLLFQESHHRPLAKTVSLQPPASVELSLVLEHIETVVAVPKLHAAFNLPLSSRAVEEEHGLSIVVSFSADSFVLPHFNEVYSGSGELLHTLYHTGHSPDFSSPAFQRMLYTDSQGVQFTLQAHAMGTLAVVTDTGHPLTLRPATVATIAVEIKFGVELEVSSVESLHTFVFSEQHSEWRDHGRVVIRSVERVVGELGSVVALEAAVRELNTHWALAFPVRVTCHIKTRVFTPSPQQQQQDLANVAVSIEQSDDSLARPSFFQTSAETVAGVGACLPSVCALGGIVSVDKSLSAEASPPHVSNGIVLGNKEQIIFYTTKRSQLVVDGRTPYYLRLEACLQSLQKPTAFFSFTASPLQRPVEPLILPLPERDSSLAGEGACFIKVAVYDCLSFTDVKLLSYSQDAKLLSLHTEVLSFMEDPACQRPAAAMAVLRASCVQFTCHSSVHVTVQSRRKSGIRDCRYWSSSSSLPWSLPPASNMTSFHFTHPSSSSSSSSAGLYRSLSRDLAELQCKAGSMDAPSSIMDPYRGTAVTFTCQV